MVDSYCIGCAYLGKLSGIPCCHYSDVTGHSRGCKSGEGCTRKMLGEKLHSPNFFSFEQSSQKKKVVEKEKPLSEREMCESEGERKRKQAERNRKLLQGRQKVAIVEFRDKNGMKNRELANLLEISESTLQKWITEYSKADWDKLSSIGLNKPQDIP